MPMHVPRCLILALSLALGAGLSGPASETAVAGRGTVVALSDIHFNPFDDPSLVPALIRADYRGWKAIFGGSRVRGYGGHRGDTNFELLVSALEHARRAAARPDFIVIGGDFLAHNFGTTFAALSGDRDPAALMAFVGKTIALVTLLVAERFPETPIYPALGNNDSDCGDYQLQPGGQFLAATAQTWKGLFKGAANTAAFLRTFPVRGSYTVLNPRNAKHRLLVLNTVFFAQQYRNACGDQRADPAGDEMDWCEAQLRAAARDGEKVWLVYHVPPGVDVYATLHGKSGAPVLFMEAEHNRRFLELVGRYSSAVVGALAGHTHMDSFELVGQGAGRRASSFVLMTPAVSPLFGNNPGFRVLTYDRRSAVVSDYATHYLNLGVARPRWALEYRFGRAYGLPAVDALSLQVIYQLLPIDYRGYRTKYSAYYNVGNRASPAFPEAAWPAYWSGIGNLTADEFTRWATMDQDRRQK